MINDQTVQEGVEIITGLIEREVERLLSDSADTFDRLREEDALPPKFAAEVMANVGLAFYSRILYASDAIFGNSPFTLSSLAMYHIHFSLKHAMGPPAGGDAIFVNEDPKMPDRLRRAEQAWLAVVQEDMQ